MDKETYSAAIQTSATPRQYVLPGQAYKSDGSSGYVVKAESSGRNKTAQEILRSSQIANYLNSGQTSFEHTTQFQKEANDYYQQAQEAGDAEGVDYWRNTVDALTQQSYYDNNKRKEDNRAERDELEKQAQNYYNWLRTSDLEYGYDGLSFQTRHGLSASAARQALVDARTRQKELDAEYATFGENTDIPRDQALGRLKNGLRGYRKLATEQVNAEREELKSINEQLRGELSAEERQSLTQRRQELNEQLMQWGPEDLAQKMYEDDKAYVDDFDRKYNGGTKPTNALERAEDVIDRFGKSIGSAGAGIVATGLRSIDYASRLNAIPSDAAADLEIEQYAGGTILDTSMLEHGKKEREEYTKQWNENSITRKPEVTGDQYGEGNIDLFDRDTGLRDKDGNLMTLNSISFEEDGKEVLIPTVVKKDGTWTKLSEKDAIDWYHKTGEYLGKFDSADEADAYAEQLHEQQDKMYNIRGLGNGGVLGRTSVMLEEVADRLDEEAQEALAEAKNGLGWGGRFLVDVSSTALDIGFDAFTGGGLVTMAARVFGGSANEARRAGASVGRQALYGASKAATEILTEKLADGLAIVYGDGGITGDIIEKAIGKLAKTDAGANIIRLISGAASEGMEEVISGLLDPFSNWIIDEQSRGKYISQIDVSELLYDFLLGAAMGFAGSAGEFASGGYVEKNAAQTDAIRQELDRSIPLSQRELNKYNAREAQLEGRLKDRTERVLGDIARGLEDSSYSGEDGVKSKIGRIREVLGNRHEKITHPIAEGMEGAGYVNETNQSDNYRAATGMTPEEADAKYDRESWDKAHSEAPERPQPQPAYDREVEDTADTPDGDGSGEPQEGPKSQRSESQAPDSGNMPGKGEGSVGLKEKGQSEGGKTNPRVQQSKDDIDSGKTNDKKLASVVKMADAYVGSGRTIKAIKKNIFARSGEAGEASLVDKVANWMEREIGGHIFTKKIGGTNGTDIILNRRGIKNDIAHGVGEEKAATFQALPDILRKGSVVSTTKVNGEPVSYIIAGKVNLMGKPVNVYCLVKKDGSGNNRFYLHEVSDGNGNLYYQMNDDGSIKEESKSAPSALQDPSAVTPQSAEKAPSAESIPQAESESKPEVPETKKYEPPQKEEKKPEPKSEPKEEKPKPKAEKKADKPAKENADEKAELANKEAQEKREKARKERQAEEERKAKEKEELDRKRAEQEEESKRQRAAEEERKAKEREDAKRKAEESMEEVRRKREAAQKAQEEQERRQSEREEKDKASAPEGGEKKEASGPKNQTTKIAESSKPKTKLDIEYENAIKSGDMAKAKQLVEEAAKQAGYTIHAYKAADGVSATVFGDNLKTRGSASRGHYFVEGNANANNADITRAKDGVYNVFLKSDNELNIKEEATPEQVSRWYALAMHYGLGKEFQRRYQAFTEFRTRLADNSNKKAGTGRQAYVSNNDVFGILCSILPTSDLIYTSNGVIGDTGRNVEIFLKSLGYSGIISPANIAADGTPIGATVHVVYDPNQIKSAEAIEYDDNGDIIPLNERFNLRNEDMRYTKEREVGNGQQEGTPVSDNEHDQGGNRETREGGGSVGSRDNTADSQTIERPPFRKATSDEAKEDYRRIVEDFLKDGHVQIPRSQYTPAMKAMERIAHRFGIDFVTFFNGFNAGPSLSGLTPAKNAKEVGIFSSFRRDGVGRRTVHELIHAAFQWASSNGILVSKKSIVEKLVKSGAISKAAVVDAFVDMSDTWGDIYYSEILTKEQLDEYHGLVTPNMRFNWLQENLTQDIQSLIGEYIYEEILSELASKSTAWLKLDAEEIDAAGNAARAELIDALDLFEDSFDNIDETVKALDKEVDELINGAEPETKVADPNAPGVVRTSQSDNRQRAIKGERNALESQAKSLNERLNTGDGTYISKSNADRTDMANKVTTGETAEETTQKSNEQYERLLAKEKGTWTDDDVVIAQKLMGDMLKAVRDYQMNRPGRIKRIAYLRLAERYNALQLRHTAELSKAGQKLQAKYMFSVEEEILNRAAHTFLFSKDGRLAPSATNVKIYSGMENIASKIGKAVEAQDAKALAQICKDISDIRGVKKMFGRLYNYASKVETDILNSIAKEEHGAQALETLAYGNLMAICDDVQPYKALNAAKTIRIMNMLSNMATIVNNVTNNAVSGLTSTNALAQWSSGRAAKAFENIIGRPVLGKEARGGALFNKEIRNAEFEALKMATLAQLYGVNQEGGKLELKGDKGLFNPNSNAFESTMALYKFFTGMGIEATDQVKAAGLMKAMQKGIDELYAAKKITEGQKAEMEREAKHEVDRLLYKDDNRLSTFIEAVRNKLNKASFGNEDIGTIGLGDITMAFAKIPANVVRARLYATPEGCLVQLIQYGKGVAKAKRMHSETMARQIMESHAAEKAKLNDELNDAYELDVNDVGIEAKQAAINKVKEKLAALNRECWNEARTQCSGGVYDKLARERDNYGLGLDFDDACTRLGYHEATEMSQFEAATLSRKIGKAATSAGMVALGAALRSLGALRDFDQEPDEELRKMLKQKGYSGLMLNLSAIIRPGHEWQDGDHILDADFLEVVAMPLSIGATAQECAMNAEAGGRGKAFVKGARTTGLGKIFNSIGDIPGMADAINMYNAINNQYGSDNAAKGLRVRNAIVEYLANTIPSFLIPNAYTQLGAGLDNRVRDVYTSDNILQQAGNIVLNKTWLGRKKIPVSVDMWGDERKYGENVFWGVINKTLLPGDRLIYHVNEYEKELMRLNHLGYKGALPKLSVSGSFDVGDETYTMDADEKREFRYNRNKAQAEAIQTFLDSETYNQLDDAQKVAVIKELKMDCERDARQNLLNGRGLDVQVTRAKWEEALDLDDSITFLGAKQIVQSLWDDEEKVYTNPAAMDDFIRNQYGGLSADIKDLLNNADSHLDNLYGASKVGITSEMWQKGYAVYRQYTSDEGRDEVDGGYKDWEATEMWTKIQKATGASDRQMEWFESKDGFRLTRTMSVDPEKYHTLVDSCGWSRDAASALTKKTSELQPGHGNETVSYKQRLRAISEVPGVSDNEQWEAFYEYCPKSYTNIIKKMTQYRKDGVKYVDALKKYRTSSGPLWWED